MVRRVRGEQPLPGATESLLQATKMLKKAARDSFAEYLSVSVSVSKEGRVRVTKLTMDPASGTIIPDYLDAFQAVPGEPVQMAEIVSYWAQEVRDDARGDGV